VVRSSYKRGEKTMIDWDQYGNKGIFLVNLLGIIYNPTERKILKRQLKNLKLNFIMPDHITLKINL